VGGEYPQFHCKNFKGWQKVQNFSFTTRTNGDGVYINTILKVSFKSVYALSKDLLGANLIPS